jgi:thiol-disulfide isomerase/thioredoxin
MYRRKALIAATLVPLTGTAVAGIMDWFTGAKLGQVLPEYDAEYLGAEPSREQKLFLVDFWATWCAPCRIEFPHLNALHEAYSSQGLEVVGLTKETKAVAQAFLPKVDIRYKIGAGGTKPLQSALSIKALPYAVLVSKENKIIWRGQSSELSAAEVERYLRGAALSVYSSPLVSIA